jgi:hypothetical protein
MNEPPSALYVSSLIEVGRRGKSDAPRKTIWMLRSH